MDIKATICLKCGRNIESISKNTTLEKQKENYKNLFQPEIKFINCERDNYIEIIPISSISFVRLEKIDHSEGLE